MVIIRLSASVDSKERFSVLESTAFAIIGSLSLMQAEKTASINVKIGYLLTFSLSQFDYNDILKNESAPVHALSTENPRSLSDKIIELNSGSTIGFFPSG